MSSSLGSFGARAFFAACSIALTACTTTRTEEPSTSALASITRTEPLRAWKLVETSALLGIVVQFADPARPDDPARHFYSVRNPWQQELGTLDAQGRAYRIVPHQREAHWVGTGTVLQGAREILGGSETAELVEVGLDELRLMAASAR